MSQAKFYVALAAALLVVAGCGKKSAQQSNTSNPNSDPNIRQLKKLNKTDVVEGKGPEMAIGDALYVTYTGTLKDGTEFDSNEGDDGAPYTVIIGAHTVIPGWEQGLVGMKVGGTRKLEVPTDLGYGNRGSGEKVPPGADLYFTVKLHDAVRKGEEGIFDKEDKVVGSGAVAKAGSLVDVNYTITLANGKIVDSKLDQKKPITFRLGPKLKEGDRVTYSGVSAGIEGMKVGGVRKLRIPPLIGFLSSTNPAIPPNSLVNMEIRLRRVH